MHEEQAKTKHPEPIDVNEAITALNGLLDQIGQREAKQPVDTDGDISENRYEKLTPDP
jgi:hypothetical protein